MLPCLNEIAENHYGRKVLLYLLAPRLPAYFSPSVIQQLTHGDGNKHRYVRNWTHLSCHC